MLPWVSRSILLIFIISVSSSTRVRGIKACFTAFTDYREVAEDVTLELHALTSTALCPACTEKLELSRGDAFKAYAKYMNLANDIGNAYANRGE